MRIKLNLEQLNKLAQRLSFEVILEGLRDVRGMLEVPGQEMPWDETGLSKFGNSYHRPSRLTSCVETSNNAYIYDIHPALARHNNALLSLK